MRRLGCGSVSDKEIESGDVVRVQDSWFDSHQRTDNLDLEYESKLDSYFQNSVLFVDLTSFLKPPADLGLTSKRPSLDSLFFLVKWTCIKT